MEKHKYSEQKQHIEKKEEHIVDEKEENEKNDIEEKDKEEKDKDENNKDEKKIEDIIAEKDKRINELMDKYLRSLAELDNFRKRTVKEKQEFEKNTKNEAINIFLPILDNLERAISAIGATQDIESLRKGIEMIIKQFKDILKDLGVKETETKGIYNPEIHHVIHKEHVEGKSDGEILEVYQKGYMLDDKIIRPAMVKVAYIPEDKVEPEKSEKKENV